MSLAAYVPVPGFLPGMPVSSIDLEVLRKNAALLYETALKFEVPVYQQGIDRRKQGATGNENSGITGVTWENFYHGSFAYHTGMTKLRIEGYREVATGGDAFKIYIMVNGAWQLLNTETFTGGSTGNWAWEYTINTLGFQENEIVQVQIDYQKNSGAAPSSSFSVYHVLGVFAYPLTLPDSWPGLPTMTSNGVHAATLNQISNACDWLMRRLNICPVLPITASVYATLSFGRSAVTGDSYWNTPDQSMWSGAALASNQRTKFRIGGTATYRDGQERYILYKDNVAVDWWPSSSTFSTAYSTQAWELEADMTANTLSHFRVGNQMVPNTGLSDNEATGKGQTRHNIDYSLVENNGGYTISTSSNDTAVMYAPRNNITYAQLRNKLRGIVDMLQYAYNTINASPLLFTRAYLIRPMTARRNEDFQYLYKTQMYRFNQRKGQVLWLRGRGVTVSYGPMKVEREDTNKYDYDFLFNEEVIAGDKMQSSFIYLDTLPGLFYGMPYYVRGTEVRYAVEMLRG